MMLPSRVQPISAATLALAGLLLHACADPRETAPAAEADPAGPPAIAVQPAVSDASLRGVDVRGDSIVWASGSGGTVLKSDNAGLDWQRIVVPGGEELDFRDVEILAPSTVLLMSAGSGDASGIYRTADGGETWELVLQNTEEKAFFNSFAFWDASTGILTSDSYDGKPYFLKTEDGGQSWRRVGEAGLPPLLEGEYNFAASGTCVAVAGEGQVWMATGGSAARVFHSRDGGETWEVSATPIASGTASSGIFSVAFRDTRNGVAVGGDYEKPELDQGNLAWTDDGGETWNAATSDTAITQKATAVHLGGGRYLAAGRAGLAYSEDDGHTWRVLEPLSFYAAAYDEADGVGWLVGAGGAMARFE